RSKIHYPWTPNEGIYLGGFRLIKMRYAHEKFKQHAFFLAFRKYQTVGETINLTWQRRYLKEILTVNVPLIHLDKVHIILAHIQFVAVNIMFRSKEDTDDRLNIFVAVDGDVIGEGFMIQTILTCLYQQRLSLLVTAYRYGVVEH
ncbi:hypothetical protein ALC62_08329, partial [Cyphomyrmex costatus]